MQHCSIFLYNSYIIFPHIYQFIRDDTNMFSLRPSAHTPPQRPASPTQNCTKKSSRILPLDFYAYSLFADRIRIKVNNFFKQFLIDLRCQLLVDGIVPLFLDLVWNFILILLQNETVLLI